MDLHFKVIGKFIEKLIKKIREEKQQLVLFIRDHLNQQIQVKWVTKKRSKISNTSQKWNNMIWVLNMFLRKRKSKHGGKFNNFLMFIFKRPTNKVKNKA